MARPRKMTTEQMLLVVDSYYATKAEGNARLMKCSLIADYAANLGYVADGYDFRRNPEVREHIECLKIEAEVFAEETAVTAFKSLDVAGLIRNNPSMAQLTQALTELNDYWKRIYDHAEQISKENSALRKEKTEYQEGQKKSALSQEKLVNEYGELSQQNNKLIVENRYLRKMLRTYLYPDIANEILVQEKALKGSGEKKVTDTAFKDMTELGAPQSLREAASKDIFMQSEEERLISKMWELCDE
ncbi:hypothetical protein GKG47_17975 [Lactonifactor sp. BIOML-A3]|uniref:hypothetical protein n=1 Tax=unclassified Lactonifactor TaxID=2636670 RepID=UPI0012AFA589|nr:MULTISPECIES: hypothetical protein [unclassified Lactonifactor]MSA03422.1 hypothetical protein [Lactonifactor sp. BIOML-A5]MSA09771.1 hypothetical protein [Lactonifactor sp. BIOML-A4]MSA14313.1 hypothetical protein [Lactonifactor sp. BIOML-A3]MSA18776.1 hypothetical protein [Lactonifactor sp. BIOML-A2]MSA39558.1 hypothetical protein [Lactonifactor sp. BIOML-A1]